MKSCLILFFVVLQPLSAEILDGRWNSRPWDLETLRAKVAAEEPDAIAEWAYCLRETWYDEAITRKEFYRLAKKAADANSPLGKALLARCYEVGYGTTRDLKLARYFAQSAHDEGHPLGSKTLASIYRKGSPSEENIQQAVNLTRLSAQKNCLIAMYNRSLGYREGKTGYLKDRDRGVKGIIRLITDHSCLYSAQHYLYLRCYFDLIPDRLHSEEALNKALDLTKKNARIAGHSASLGALAGYYLRKEDDQLGMDYLFKASNHDEPYYRALQMAFYLAYNRKMGRKEQLGAAERATLRRIAAAAVEAGGRGRSLNLYAGHAHYFGRKMDHRKALKYYLKAYDGGSSRALTGIGSVLSNGGIPADLKDYPKSLLAHEANCGTSTYALQILIDNLNKGPKELRNPVKLSACYTEALKEDGFNKAWKKKYRHRNQKLLKEMTNDRTTKVKALIASGYPRGEEHVKAAKKEIDAYLDQTLRGLLAAKLEED